MPWRVRGTVVSWANRFVGVPSCLVPPRPAVPPCAAPSRRARGMSGFWIRQFLDVPCMKRVYRDKDRRWSIGQQLVSSQERRARSVPRVNRLRINCGSNAGFVPPPVYIAFRLFVLLKRRSGQVCSMPWRVRGTVGSWANRFVHHGADGDLRLNLRLRRSRMGGYSSIFGVEERRWGGSSKMGGFFEDGVLRRTPLIFEEPSPLFEEPSFHLRRTPHLRYSAPKIEELPPHLQSSIFGPEDRRTLPSSIFGPEEWVEGRTEEGGWDFFEDGEVLRRWGGSSIFRARNDKPPIFHFLGPKNEEPPPIFHVLGPKNEEPPPLCSSSDPPRRPTATSSSQLS